MFLICNTNGLYKGDNEWLPRNENILESFNNTWIYDPVLNNWQCEKMSDDGRKGDMYVDGIYEIMENGSLHKYCFDKVGNLKTGTFMYGQEKVVASTDDNNKGVILNDVDATAKLNIMSISTTNDYVRHVKNNNISKLYDSFSTVIPAV